MGLFLMRGVLMVMMMRGGKGDIMRGLDLKLRVV
jgi:hypothetical protein